VFFSSRGLQGKRQKTPETADEDAEKCESPVRIGVMKIGKGHRLA